MSQAPRDTGQIADPVTLYAQPANVFVADFIGTGSLLHGTASAGTFTTLGTPIPCHNPQQISGDAVLMLRPESVRISASQDGALLAGEVVETHFYGGSSTTSVRVQGLDAPIVASHPGAPQHAVGDRVGISWDTDSAVLLEVSA